MPYIKTMVLEIHGPDDVRTFNSMGAEATGWWFDGERLHHEPGIYNSRDCSPALREAISEVLAKGDFPADVPYCSDSDGLSLNGIVIYADSELVEARKEIEKLRADLAQAERETVKALEQRDSLEIWLDRFAYAVAPVELIGEHSSANDPWQKALDLLTPAVEVNRLREEAAYAVEALNGAENRRLMWRDRTEAAKAAIQRAHDLALKWDKQDDDLPYSNDLLAALNGGYCKCGSAVSDRGAKHCALCFSDDEEAGESK